MHKPISNPFGNNNQPQVKTNVQRPDKPKSGPIEQFIKKGGDTPKLDHMGSVRNCPNC